MNSVKDIKKVFVAGAGLMGSQIALNAAIEGYETWLYDSFPAAIERADGWYKNYLAGRVEKGRLTQEQVEAAAARFHLCTSLEEGAKDADLTIEAIIEQTEEKQKFFRQLDKLVAPEALITTNSSYLVSSMFADCVTNPSRLANLHYFNPALAMKLVEIVKGPHTGDKTVEILYDYVKSVGKIPVIINKEVEGFIVNRFSSAIANTAMELLEMEVATAQDIDLAVENGLNHPMGPFRLMDLTGIDLAYLVTQRKSDEGQQVFGLKELKEKYDNNEHGRKTGKGWYDYSK